MRELHVVEGEVLQEGDLIATVVDGAAASSGS